jgi:hypothetical protein
LRGAALIKRCDLKIFIALGFSPEFLPRDLKGRGFMPRCKRFVSGYGFKPCRKQFEKFNCGF